MILMCYYLWRLSVQLALHGYMWELIRVNMAIYFKDRI